MGLSKCQVSKSINTMSVNQNPLCAGGYTCLTARSCKISPLHNRYVFQQSLCTCLYCLLKSQPQVHYCIYTTLCLVYTDINIWGDNYAHLSTKVNYEYWPDSLEVVGFDYSLPQSWCFSPSITNSPHLWPHWVCFLVYDPHNKSHLSMWFVNVHVWVDYVSNYVRMQCDNLRVGH